MNIDLPEAPKATYEPKDAANIIKSYKTRLLAYVLVREMGVSHESFDIWISKDANKTALKRTALALDKWVRGEPITKPDPKFWPANLSNNVEKGSELNGDYFGSYCKVGAALMGDEPTNGVICAMIPQMAQWNSVIEVFYPLRNEEDAEGALLWLGKAANIPMLQHAGASIHPIRDSALRDDYVKSYLFSGVGIHSNRHDYAFAPKEPSRVDEWKICHVGRPWDRNKDKGFYAQASMFELQKQLAKGTKLELFPRGEHGYDSVIRKICDKFSWDNILNEEETKAEEQPVMNATDIAKKAPAKKRQATTTDTPPPPAPPAWYDVVQDVRANTPEVEDGDNF